MATSQMSHNPSRAYAMLYEYLGQLQGFSSCVAFNWRQFGLSFCTPQNFCSQTLKTGPELTGQSNCVFDEMVS